MKTNPIPNNMLVHSCTYYPYEGKDSYQKPTYGTGQEILNVKFEPVSMTTLNSQGEQKDDRLVMFYDGVNSQPIFILKEFDKINFDGQDYIVREVRPFYGLSSQVHHWEIQLV